MNILITGVHGFVGANLVVALKEKNNIYGLDIVTPSKDGVIQTFSWDDLDTPLPHFDAIIHLAGKAHDIKNQVNFQEYFNINTGLTQRIFDYFLKSDVSRFVFFSSVKAACDSVETGILTEDIVPGPHGPYGESKIAAENYIMSKAGIWGDSERGKWVYIVRPCMIHGPGNKGNLNLLYQIVEKGLPWPLGSFENKRSFCSIDNLCFFIRHIIADKINSGIYHLADDESISTNELIRAMCAVMGKKAHIWKINKRAIQQLAKLGTLLHLPLNQERLKKLTENYIVSNAKIKAAIGIHKMPVTAYEGITKTIQSFIVQK